MKLRTFKNKNDKLYYFILKSKKLDKVFLINPQGFDSKIDRNNALFSVINSISNKKYTAHKTKKGKRFLLLKINNEQIQSKKFTKNDFKTILKELKNSIKSLKKKTAKKPHFNKSHNSNSKQAITKIEVLKKEKKPKSEKVYLKKGNYHFNDIYYDIFLSSNGKHYYSFINNAGKTVLLNGNIKGFDNLEDAEKSIEEVLKFAPHRENFEIKTAKDGKFFFNLYNNKKEKIAKSFFFRKREDIENSINEFIGKIPPIVIATDSIDSTPNSIEGESLSPLDNKSNTQAHIEREERRITAERERIKLEEKREEARQRKLAAERERIALEEKRKEDLRLIRLEREKKEKELAATKKLELERKKRQAAINIQTTNNSNRYNDKDFLDGCFKWLGLILLLCLLLFAISYFKGCFGSKDNIAESNIEISQENNGNNDLVIDSLENDKTISLEDASKTNSNYTNNEPDSNFIDQKENSSESNGSNNDADFETTFNDSGKDDISSKKEIYNKNISIPDCGCSKNAIVFKIPNQEAKSVNRLGTNPQFGNTHGLNAADFFEELKHAYRTNSWDRKYLNYLYKAMGYKNGFLDASATQITQSSVITGTKGILGFGKYSGYGYSKLDLKGKDLETFKIEAANGCHINFMKTCGNLFFICD